MAQPVPRRTITDGMLSKAPPPPDEDDFEAVEIAHDEEAIEDVVVYCCIPLYIAGYFVCFLQLVEAIAIALTLVAYESDNEATEGFLAALNNHNPLKGLLSFMLDGLVVGDLLFAFFGLLGLWLCANKMPIELRRLWRYHAIISTRCIAIMGFWRLVVTVCAGPFVGFMLAFEPPGYNKGIAIFLTIFYVLFSLHTLWVSLLVYRLAVEFTGPMQDEMNRLLLDCRAKMIEIARQSGDAPYIMLWEDELPRIFGSFSLEQTELGVSLLLAGLSLGWFTYVIVTAGTIGAWAFPVPHPSVPEVKALEITAYTITAVASVIGAMSMVYHQGARDREIYYLHQDAEGRSVDVDLQEVAITKKRCTSGMLIYVMMSVLRFTLFVPITGMTLIMTDVCGIYLHGLSHLEEDMSPGSSHFDRTPLHCTNQDILALIVVPLVGVLDAYLLYGLLNLYFHYHLLNGRKPGDEYKPGSFTRGRPGKFLRATAEALTGTRSGDNDLTRRQRGGPLPVGYSTLGSPLHPAS
mmetsp:Transcript_13365/g.31331  ORF Transcript_13365/g.31331 Transcript_13365/m.31331 type:complete len:520 (+) Transcript_13365:112-1671(+)